MVSNEIYLLVSCLITVSTAIRVDWNTNKGPIVPPTPRTTVRPQPPYREPAPVWEDQSDDIPNPNPYVYVLPPPSRPNPRPNNNNNYYYSSNNYGNVVAPDNANSYQQNSQTNEVSALAPKYIPNVGFKYFAVVPNNNNNNYNKISGNKATKYASSISANGLSNGYFGYGDKVQGKYNPKTKKYKAYEKVKYVPLNYNSNFDFELPYAESYVPIFDQQLLIETQQLPLEAAPQPFRATVAPIKQQTETTTKPTVEETTSIAKSQKKAAADKAIISSPNAVAPSKSS